MKSLIHGILIVACLVAVQQPVFAEEQENVEELAERLIELGQMDATMEQMSDAMLTEMRNLAAQAAETGKSDVTPEQLAEVEAIMRDEMATLRREMIGPMEDMLIAFYKDNFSRDEMVELVEIYSSPTFQKQYRYMPELTGKLVHLLQGYDAAHRGRLRERLEALKAKYDQD
ncbi:MAG: DUF2059 domain-containing protein [Alphaproteobacteria bacterium]|nr:DUF2059 domain-containing protein [Alphaproteobacteria bacterium]